ncbi:hypothetical protein [Halosimplex marinum]|uniref:hypothetical protein n=1 Tax=Halosimplex marinum TaxID=3396620 RepID=UPI003F5675E0
MKLVVTADIEGETDPASYRSTDAFREVARRLDGPLSLFVTPDVVRNRTDHVREWLDAGYPVGLHVHPARLTGGSDWLDEYDEAAIHGMVGEGLDVFDDHLDHAPPAFRAGRWAYSEALLRALDRHDVRIDASLCPDAHREPYERHGVTEYPMTVYRNPLVHQLLRPYGIDSIPLHADAFLANRPLAVGFLGVTLRLLVADRPYLMVNFHDYDVLADPLRSRIVAYVSALADRLDVVALTAVDERLRAASG